MNFIIIHGIYGHPQENWFPWLKKELGSKGYAVIAPKFPTPIGQTLENWLRTLNKSEEKINNETVLIGHSLGAPFILNYLEKTDKIIKAAFLVAPYHKLLENKFKALNEGFVDKDFDWEKIKKHCGKFFIVCSDNDQYIDISVPKEMAQLLNAELKIIHNGGHLNKKAGFDRFPVLLEMINSSILV